MSVYTKPVSIHCIDKIKDGVESLTVSKCIDVYCIVYTLSIHWYRTPFSQNTIFSDVYTPSIHLGDFEV